jgi:hypothetical protein
MQNEENVQQMEGECQGEMRFLTRPWASPAEFGLKIIRLDREGAKSAKEILNFI